MSSDSTTKVTVLRTFQRGDLYLKKGDEAELPISLAKELAAGDKPAVKIKAGK